MAKKKVLYVITKSNWGGAQRYVFDLATHLPKEQFEVIVALGGTGTKDAKVGLLATKLEEQNVRTIFIQSFMRDISVLKEWQAFKELLQIFKTEKPDIVHLNSSKAGGIGALAARVAGIKKIIFTSHGLAWQEDRNVLSKTAIYIVSRITFLLCHSIITITSKNYKAARRCFLCHNKIVLIHNGIAPLVYLSKEEARLKLGLPLDAFVVGGIGELTWNKGWHYLLRAAGNLKRNDLEMTIAIAGSGEERDFLETICKEEGLEGRVVLPGFVENAAALVRAFDIFVLPSVKEGLPYVLLEAGQAGATVVASDIGGVSDIVQGGVSGFLVEAKKPQALEIAVKKLMESKGLRAQYGTALQAYTLKEFSLEKMLTETTKLYLS